MAREFQVSEQMPGYLVAELTTGERLFLVRAVADVLELLGEDEDFFVPTDGTTDSGAQSLGNRFNFDSLRVEDLVNPPAVPGFLDTPEVWTGPELEEPEEIAVEHLEAVIDALSDTDVTPAPTDPAVRRLLPDASLDPDVAAEFRKYTDFDLREQKVQRLMQLSDRLTDVEPSTEDDLHLDFPVALSDAESFAGALGDLRLVLGERLGLRTDEDSTVLYNQIVEIAGRMQSESIEAYELSPTEERTYIMGMLFELAGYLQESLTTCMLEDLRAKRAKK